MPELLNCKTEKRLPQSEAIKLHSNQNKNKKPFSQVYFLFFTGNREAA